MNKTMKTIENVSVNRSLPNHGIEKFPACTIKYEYYVRQFRDGLYFTMFETTEFKKAWEHASRLASLEPYEVSIITVRTVISIVDSFVY